MKKDLKINKLTKELRKKAVNLKSRKFLMTKFCGSKQESDLSLSVNCHGFGRIHHFRQQADDKWILDPLPMCPASKFFGIKKTEVLLAQVFQLAVCNFCCWYCFVDHDLLSANRKFSEFITANQLLQWMLDESIKSNVIDLSGGQPDIVPEYPLWFLQTRSELGLNSTHYIWMDDNLSTDYMWRYLSDSDIEYMLSAKGFSRVGCLKGFDPKSFAFNTGADGQSFSRQIELLSRLVKAGFDQYGYITLTTLNCEGLEGKIAQLLDKIQIKVHENFPLRIVPLRIFEFNANSEKFIKQAEENQFYVLEVWQSEMQKRFSASQLAIPISEIKIGGKND